MWQARAWFPNQQSASRKVAHAWRNILINYTHVRIERARGWQEISTLKFRSFLLPDVVVGPAENSELKPRAREGPGIPSITWFSVIYVQLGEQSALLISTVSWVPMVFLTGTYRDGWIDMAGWTSFTWMRTSTLLEQRAKSNSNTLPSHHLNCDPGWGKSIHYRTC